MVLKLDDSSGAYKVVYNALLEGSLVEGIAGVGRSTGQLIIAKIK